MTAKSRWLAVGIATFLVLLLLGRWLAVGAADRLWAEALGVGETHTDVARMRTLLFLVSFSGAAVWCLGNLYLVYRSIGSVTVPRRLGNIEIVEAVPRHYLLMGFVVLGVGLALALSFRAGDWWYARALTTGAVTVGLSDPILQRDASYYLFSLPWTRTLHSYVTFLSAVMLGVSLVLYTAVGAVRAVNRRVEVNDDARRHLGMLFAAFALALVWGYRLEPAEYLAGIHNVPFDSVLVDVRFPTARLLSAVGLITCAASLLWIRYRRTSVVVFGWGTLVVLSFVGHYLVPAVAAGVRSDLELHSNVLSEAREELTAYAYGLADARVIREPSPRAVPETAVTDALPVEHPILWDEFAVNLLLNRIAAREPYLRFAGASLGRYRTADGQVIPVILGVREVNLPVAQAVDPAFSWERVHLEPYGSTRGVVAVRADLVAPDGRPLFVPDLRRPDSAVATVADVRLADSTVLFGPTTAQFAIVSRRGIAGVPVGGIFRRVALAWKLQSWKVLTSPAVRSSSIMLWHRQVQERLETFAPFAQFGDVHPVIADDRLRWTAYGYVTSTGFPLAARTEWRGRGVGYLRAGYVGVVDAATGATSVFLLPEADAVSRAWAALAPDVVTGWRDLPPEMSGHLAYPRALFEAQLGLVRDTTLPRRPGFFGRLRSRPVEEERALASYSWLGPHGDERLAVMRRLATIPSGTPARLAGLVEGAASDRGLALTLVRYRRPWEVPGPEQTAARFVAARDVEPDLLGRLKTVRVRDGVLSLQSAYATSASEDSVPTLVSVAVEWAGAVGEAPTFGAALAEALVSDRTAGMVSTDWAAARRWFERLDAARRSGDWVAFGRAYNELRRLLTGEERPCRDPGCSQ